MKPETLRHQASSSEFLIVLESINMGLDHKLFLQLFVIGFWYFAVELEKDKYRYFL